MESGSVFEKKFSSPEEEVKFLREKLKMKEFEIGAGGARKSETAPVHEIISDYAARKSHDVLSGNLAFPEQKTEEIVLKLKPEAHDNKMEELLGILLEHGVRNALSVVEKLNNPHIDDDFHRLLVQYLQSGSRLPGVEKNKELWKALKMKLFEIILPEGEKEPAEKDFKKIIAVMEQFYAGMFSISDGRDNLPGKNYFTLEISLSNESNEIVFYSAVPEDKGDLLEKQLMALYPRARLKEISDDYNVFNDEGASLGAYAELGESQVFPIKTYDAFENDPLPVILNVFSKLEKVGEGAAIQFVITPAGDYFLKKYGDVLDKIKDGASVKEATNIPWGLGSAFIKEVKSLALGYGSKKNPPAGGSEKEDNKIDENVIKHLSEKIGSTIVNTNIRVIASAKTTERAGKILSDLESAFNQFNLPGSNTILFKPEKSRSNLKKLFHEFSYRTFSYDHPMPLNVRELATLLHFPSGENVSSQAQLKQVRAAQAPASLDMPKDGIFLGTNKYRHLETPIHLSAEDRMRHFYVIGQTGTGKTTLLKNMIVQDMEAGNGVCMIDPHGTDIMDILANVPPSRAGDVIYFDPADMSRPMGLNMLEYDRRFPEQKTFVVNELLAIFNKLFDMKVAGGPMFEQYFRNSALLVMEHPESGNTLIDIGRVMSNKEYRDMKLGNCKNPLIKQFWDNAVRTTGEQSLANFVPYITNKFDVFLSNDYMRPIVSQEHSSFNFRDIMDSKKIFLINLSKGRLGDINANLLGLILVGKILMAALSRVDVIGSRLSASPDAAQAGEVPDFYLYIDEFQNVTTDSIATILSEARKYRLGLNIAHQYIKQLEENIKNAVFGNVGSMAVYRVGSEDAEFLAKQFEPVFTARDIIGIDNYNCYVKMLVRGQPSKPFSMEVPRDKKGDRLYAEKIKELSRAKYGRDKAEVEAEMMARYKKPPVVIDNPKPPVGN